MNDKPRIGGAGWEQRRPRVLAVYNADYTPSGRRYAHYDKPWTVISADEWGTFPTHAEALAYAFEKAATK